MQVILAALLFAQTVSSGISAYTYNAFDSVALATPSGRFLLDLGLGCDDLTVGQNVILLPGSAGVASIASPGSAYQCNVYVASRLSDEPCNTDDNGFCEISLDETVGGHSL